MLTKRWKTLLPMPRVLQLAYKASRIISCCQSYALIVVIALVLCPVWSQAAYSQSARTVEVPATVRPGFEWTTVQDLKPDARAINRPIKDKWAVVVGIGNFAEKPLNNELRMDMAAKEFYSYLTDPDAGRFDKDHVRLLIDADA
ncbi:MAG: hypothetical protein HY711_10380, partial [Candidatus Melainabacteria bacterium]|nr:hypothetical protein [Candidatus Melainabacteria bacterium]